MRWVWRALLVLLLLPVAVAALLATPWGLRQVAGLAAGFVPGLVLEGVEGPLPGRLAVVRLAMTDADGAWVEVEGLELLLDWRAAFDRRAQITRLAAARVALHRLPASAPAQPAPPGITLPSLPRLPLDVALDALEIARLELGAPVLGQAVAARVAGAGGLADDDAALRLVAERLDAPGGARLSARVAPYVLEAELVAQEPPGGVVARLAGLPEAPLDATLSLRDGAWSLAASLGEARIGGQGRAALAQGALALTLDVMAQPAPLLPEAVRPLAAQVTLAGEVTRAADGALAVRALRIDTPAGTLAGEASLAPDGALRARARLDAAAPGTFGALLPAGVAWQALGAELALDGTLAAPRVSARVQAEAPRSGIAELDALLGESIALDADVAEAGGAVSVELRAARARLGVAGRALEPMALDVTARVTDPAPLTGEIEAEGRVTGTYAAPAITATLRAPRLEGVVGGRRQEVEAASIALTASPTTVQATADGRWQDAPFTLRLDASREGDALRLSQLEASFQDATLTGSGEGSLSRGPQAGRIRLDVPDLARFPGGLAGRVTLDASATPSPQGPLLAVELQGSDLPLGGQRARIALNLDGPLEALALRLAAGSGGNTLDVAARLRAAEDAEALFTRLELRAAGERIALAAPARLARAANGDITLEPARFTAPRGGRLAMQGSLREGRIDAQAELAALPLAPFTAGAAQGVVAGNLRITGSTEAPDARFTLRAEGLRAEAAPGLPPARLTATGTAGLNAAQVEARLDAGQAVALTLAARQPRGLGAAAPIEASLRGRADLGALARPLLDAGANRATGLAVLDLRATGTPQAPQLAGSLDLQRGSFINAEQGLRLQPITARLVGQGQRIVVERFQAGTQNGGPITVQGWVEPLGADIPAELRVQARGARPVRGEIGEAVIDLDLLLRGPLLAGGALSGRVGVQRAELRIPESFGASVPTLGQVRETGPLPPGRARPTSPPPARPAPAASPAGPPLELDLRLEAPRAVFVRGRGLEAELGGDIRVAGRLDAPAVTGAFRLRRGSFDLAGRALNLTRGEARFDTGTLLPSLDFTATSRARTHTITLTIAGRVDAPELRVGAVPDLPQDEALARLLFDRETGRLSPFEIASLAQAVAQLAGIMPAGSSPADRLRQALGLDRLSAGAEQQGRGATIEAGRYVAPGVYVGVRQGTQGAAPGVGVQVEITPRLRLEGQTQTGPAGDRLGLSYEFEY